MLAIGDNPKTIELIKSIWPDFQVNKEMMQRPTPDLVHRFYSNFLVELKEKVSFLINDDCNFNQFDASDFNSTVYLFCEVARIYRKLSSSTTLTLNDFFLPNPKRTSTLMKLGTHFLIYIDYFLDAIAAVVNEPLGRVAELEALEKAICHCFKEMNENAEILGRYETEGDKLEAKLQLARKRHEEMLEKKNAQKKIHAEKSAEIERLSNECGNLEYNLSNLEKEEMDLQEQIVTDEDLKSLKDTEQCLMAEVEKLSSADSGMDDGMHVQKGTLAHLEDCLESLEGLTLDSLNVKQLGDLEELQKLKELELKNSHSKLAAAKDAEAETQNNVKRLKDQLEALQKQYSEVQEKCTTELDQLVVENKEAIESNSMKLMRCQELEKDIEQEEEEIAEIEKSQEVLKGVFFSEYKKILDTERNVVTNFNNKLISVWKRGQAASSLME